MRCQLVTPGFHTFRHDRPDRHRRLSASILAFALWAPVVLCGCWTAEPPPALAAKPPKNKPEASPPSQDSAQRAGAQANEAIKRGDTARQNKNWDLAISEYTAAIQRDPKNAGAYRRRAEAYRGRGDAYHSKGEYEAAIADFATAIRLDPRGAAAYRRRGDAYYAKDDYDKAIGDYTDAIRLNPNDAATYYNRGLAYGLKGDGVKAAADFAQAKRLGHTEAQPQAQPSAGSEPYTGMPPPTGAQLQSLPRPTRSEYERLPPGAWYIGPSGKLNRKNPTRAQIAEEKRWQRFKDATVTLPDGTIILEVPGEPDRWGHLGKPTYKVLLEPSGERKPSDGQKQAAKEPRQ